MSAPPKPWESSGMSQINTGSLQQHQSVFPGGTASRIGSVNGVSQQSGFTHGTSSSDAPRPPPRPATTGSSLSRYGTGMRGYGATAGYSSYGGGYGSSMYSPYGMRSGYGGYGSSYGSPYSSYGMMGGYGGSYGGAYGGGYGSYAPYGQQPYGHGLENRFIQLAEENSRPAFESLESLVHAFGSVSMMMESTFFAIHSSFRAVLGVAENFGRMRGLLAQVFSALTIFRAVRWAAHKLLEILRLRKPGAAEQVWSEASVEAGGGIASGAGGSSEAKSAWPIVMFMSLVVGGPYLIWKLLRSVQRSLADDPAASTAAEAAQEEPWMRGNAPCYIAQAAYSFQGRQEGDLSFNVGDVLAMAPNEQQQLRAQGWMLATRIRDHANNPVSRPSPIGYVPINHFRTIYTKNSNNIGGGQQSGGVRNVIPTTATNNIGTPTVDSTPVVTVNDPPGRVFPIKTPQANSAAQPTATVNTNPSPTSNPMPELDVQPQLEEPVNNKSTEETPESSSQ